MNEWVEPVDGTRDTDNKPAPSCPVCSQTMGLTIEHRDGEDKRVWVCSQADEHQPPPNWWEHISPP